MSDRHSVERRRDNGDSIQRSAGTARQPGGSKSANTLPAAECQAQRERLGWSMQDLATRSGFPVTTLAEFENGQRVLGLSAQVALQRILRKAARATRP
jgi:DNA-binding transcriptional regulator YiaG